MRLKAAQLLAKIDAADTEDDYDREARESEARRVEFNAWRRREWELLARQLGRRYAGCTLDNFQADTGPQQQVLESVRAYAANIKENVEAGRNVLLYGPPGTGKDHLATALMRTAIDHGVTVEWRDGADFYGEIRDRIADEKREAEFVQRFTKPMLLSLSDPVPPVGDVSSPYQLSMLFRVLDRRYRDLRPTMITLNVANRDEASRRLSPNLIDRLAHNALAVHCNWSSYRRAAP